MRFELGREATGPEFGHVVTLGDFDDGPFADVMEAKFLIGNLLDELVGSFLEPNTYFKHAMAPEHPVGSGDRSVAA